MIPLLFQSLLRAKKIYLIPTKYPTTTTMLQIDNVAMNATSTISDDLSSQSIKFDWLTQTSMAAAAVEDSAYVW